MLEKFERGFEALNFERDGFAIIDTGLNNAQCEVLADEVERVHEHFDSLKISFPELQRLGEWCIKHPFLVSKAIHEFFLSSVFEKICRRLIGSTVDLYWSTTANKPALTGKSFPWHQDAGYETGPTSYITCWTALDFVDEENGCIWVLPGSHQIGILPHEFRKSNDYDYGGVFLAGNSPNGRVPRLVEI